MTNEEMFTAIITRMDSMESGLSGLSEQIEKVESGLSERLDNVESGLSKRIDNVESGLNDLSGRMDNVESGLNDLSGRIDNLESDMNMEFRAVRIEMDTLNKSLKGDISVLNNKIDRFLYTKDIEGYEKMQIQIDLLTQGYQQLKEKIC